VVVRNRHIEIVTLLEKNLGSTTSVKALLNEDRNTLLARLDTLDRTLASFAGAIEGFAQLAVALRPDANLSQQAVSVLSQLDHSGGTRLLCFDYLDGRYELHLIDGPQGLIAFDEPRFIKDDLNMLVELGLLRIEYNSGGKPIYCLTRRASELVNQCSPDETK